MKKKEVVHIGTFTKPLGLKGNIKISIHTSDLKTFILFNQYLKVDGDPWIFDSLNIVKKKLIGKLINCNSRNCAEKLTGKKIFIDRKKLPKTDSNEYYILDLINCKVKTLSNRLLGTIVDINNFGAGNLINIKKNNGKKFYIPMNKENIVRIDINKKLVIVNPIEGIID